MKKTLITIMVILVAIPLFSQVKSARLQASGLTCAMCARAVYKGLESLPFVDKIDTDLNESAFLISFKEGKEVDIDAIRTKVEGAGFSVARLDITSVFHNETVNADTHLKIDGANYHFVGVTNKVLDGEQTFRIIDKDFLPAKELKKYEGKTKMECFKTGLAGSCCKESGITVSERIYHVSM